MSCALATFITISYLMKRTIITEFCEYATLVMYLENAKLTIIVKCIVNRNETVC